MPLAISTVNNDSFAERELQRTTKISSAIFQIQMRDGSVQNHVR